MGNSPLPSPVACRVKPGALSDAPGSASLSGSWNHLKERRVTTVKKDIHPQLNMVTVTCACGNTFETHSTKDEVRLEICSACHPFFSGKQKLIDTAGRVERFQRRYNRPAVAAS